jgi:tocopherol O-methyltransferase
MRPTDSNLLRADGEYPAATLDVQFRSERDEAEWSASRKKLVEYYEQKTQAILERYGPGPRVHFHTGFTSEPPPDATVMQLRSQLVEAQERMLTYAAEAWQLPVVAFRDVLEVGCGLGGGAIFWAEKFGAKVTAVTIAPSHIELVQRFAAQAGVACQVMPLLCDALTVPGDSCFDVAVAIDSSSSFPRREWFRRLARLLRPGGHVFIFDCFLVGSEYKDLFNRHWCARIGTLEEYLYAAREARFTLEMSEDVSLRALHFWTTTLALVRVEAHGRSLTRGEAEKLEESERAHELMRQGLGNGGLQHILMSFVRR